MGRERVESDVGDQIASRMDAQATVQKNSGDPRIVPAVRNPLEKQCVKNASVPVAGESRLVV